MQCLIVGYGSIGKRHAKLLESLGHQVYLVTSQKIDDYPNYTSITEALSDKVIDYVVIANPTYLHYQALYALIENKYQGLVLVEKPVFAKNENLPLHNFKDIFIAYNLRFHQALLMAKKLVEKDKIISFTSYVGQYLPEWRNARDYRDSYSTQKDQGGGVLRDLSHELDYALWFCGPCLEVAASGGQYSQLETTADDIYSILMRSKYCSNVSLHLNCLDRVARRDLVINTSQHTIFVDLVNGVLKIDQEIIYEDSNSSNKTYELQHQAILNQELVPSLCSYEEGLCVMRVIEAIEKSSSTRQWVSL